MKKKCFVDAIKIDGLEKDNVSTVINTLPYQPIHNMQRVSVGFLPDSVRSTPKVVCVDFKMTERELPASFVSRKVDAIVFEKRVKGELVTRETKQDIRLQVIDEHWGTFEPTSFVGKILFNLDTGIVTIICDNQQSLTKASKEIHFIIQKCGLNATVLRIDLDDEDLIRLANLRFDENEIYCYKSKFPASTDEDGIEVRGVTPNQVSLTTANRIISLTLSNKGRISFLEIGDRFLEEWREMFYADSSLDADLSRLSILSKELHYIIKRIQHLVGA